MALEPNLFGDIFLILQNRIKTEVPEIRYIEQDLGQLEVYEDRPAVSWPCVLLDFQVSEYRDQLLNVQDGDLVITVRIGHNPYSHSHNLAALEVREKALHYYELENKVYKALQGFEHEDFFNPLSRKNAATEKRDDPFRVRVLTFDCGIEDYTAQPDYQYVQPDLSIDYEE